MTNCSPVITSDHLRLSEVHRKTGAELVSRGIMGRVLGTKQKVTSQIRAPQYLCRRIRHESFFELRKGELDWNDNLAAIFEAKLTLNTPSSSVRLYCICRRG